MEENEKYEKALKSLPLESDDDGCVDGKS